jgi:hypothetical protein
MCLGCADVSLPQKKKKKEPGDHTIREINCRTSSVSCFLLSSLSVFFFASLQLHTQRRTYTYVYVYSSFRIL